ncbi:uncharacterized protein N7459_005122 [Penicillium hispanicum]|uniref:uncharacterized protein n=1 Tax=Penicillium hispanicum TaxID=1080232 RepID=UPI002541027A|nr:uncharacterized protein N7459_005122 [Penicillium hispanicum]KAJ5585322.1 hypothetical protein N7459_005122 [Penicillium hispanicum]
MPWSTGGIGEDEGDLTPTQDMAFIIRPGKTIAPAGNGARASPVSPGPNDQHAFFINSQLRIMVRLSGLQREVLSLYRQCLREIRKKPAESRGNFKSYARAEFQKHLSVNKKDFGAIEYLLRKGHRQLEMYTSPAIRNIG